MDRFKVLQDDDARGPGREEGDTLRGSSNPPGFGWFLA